MGSNTVGAFFMVGRSPIAPGRTAVHHPSMTVQQPSTIVQAAAILGIKPEAVRGRLRRGTLRGERTATGWLVWLDDPAAVRPASVQPSTSEARGEFPHVSERSDLVEQLRSENTYLRGALEQAQLALNREQETVLRLTAALQAPRQLATVDAESRAVAPESPVTASTAADAARKPWWRFWH